MLKNLIIFSTLLMTLSAIGLLFFPGKMLAVVGIVSNEQMDFLLRASGAAVASLVPDLLASRSNPVSPVSRGVLIGLAGYMFLSSVIDLSAYIQSIVNMAWIPSIVLRSLLGIVILWFLRKEMPNS